MAVRRSSKTAKGKGPGGRPAIGSPKKAMVVPWLINRNGQSITLKAELKGKVKGDANSRISLKVVVKRKHGRLRPVGVRSVKVAKVNYSCVSGTSGEKSFKSRPVRKNTGKKLTMVVETPAMKLTVAGEAAWLAADALRDNILKLAGTILHLDPNVPLNALLGTLPQYPVGTPYEAPAMRAILFTDLCGSVEQTSRLGDDGHVELLRMHNKIVRQELQSHGGREVKHTGDGIMAAFTSVASAVAFAIAAQRAFREHNQSSAVPLEVKIGISAGEPVTDDNDDLFGAAVQLAARLCDSASAGEIAASLAVRELSVGKQFRFEDRGSVQLKGFPEPTIAYRVPWRDDA